MDKTLKLSTSIKIFNSPENIWKALTDRELIKQYFFGTRVETDWRKGSPIIFKGEWEGKSYIEKGEILDIKNLQLIKYSYLTDGLDDIPDNYSLITYRLENFDGGSTLSIKQEGFRNKEAYEHSIISWQKLLEDLKKITEGL
jgi:uncharacterized protein YndB with AHSA1/START domain